jgi:DNA-binding PadR family transcriptional regulator
MTGYELAQNMKISIDSLWAATHSQIYPALRRLEEEQLVSSKSITPVGEQEFIEWLSQPIQYLPFRDPFKFWASYLDECPPEAVFRTIDAHIRLHTKRAEYLERLARSIAQGDHPLVQARMRHLPQEKVEKLKRTRSFIYYEQAAQARFEIESAQRIRQYAQELYPEYAPV